MHSSLPVSINIVCIDLLKTDAEYIKYILGKNGYQPTIQVASGAEEISACMQHLKNIDLVLIHYSAADPLLKDYIHYVRLFEFHCKILVFFEAFDEETISNALKQGADSFILRSRMEKIIDFLDKSKKTLASTKLSDEELIFKALLENTTDSLWVKDLNGKYILINNAGSEFLKRPIELIIGHDDTELFPIETAAKIRQSDRYVMESGQTQTIEEMLTTPDGVKRFFQAVKHVYRDEQGRVQGLIGTVRDITFRKQIEEALRHSEERFRVMVESIKDYAIFMVSPGGTVSAWNVGAERLIGYYPADIIGLNFSCLYSQDDREQDLPRTHLNIALNRGRHEADRWLIAQGDTSFWANVIISPMYGDFNDLLGFSVIVKDLTEQKKAEDTIKFYTERLEESNKDLEEFAFIASHDLQAPLRKVMIFSQMLSEFTNDSGKDFAVRLEKSAAKMQALITDLLELSRVNRKGQPLEVVNLNLIVADTLEDLEVMISESGAVIQMDELGCVRGDSRQLKQVFLNIISNSIKFRKKDAPPVIQIAATDVENGMTRITITDNGTGFEPQFSERIFKPFERLVGSECPGTGIGLTICKKIVERHNGKISARSQVNQGATLEILLASTAAEVTPSELSCKPS